MRIWVDRLLRGGVLERGVLFESDAAGSVVTETAGTAAPADATVLDLAVPGFANAHSHAFHRALRGRTHESGSFWTWRELMYRAAGRLDPTTYRDFAAAVFSEMVATGWTSVGEFHYVHHRPDGTAYDDHAMEIALADAAAEAGIRLVLLDTCYLAGGIGRPLTAEQARFGDADAGAWLDRWHSLRATLAGRSELVTLGAALHSVRGVPREALGRIARELPGDVPLHIHLSEQPAENEDCVAAYGLTPTELLAEEGVLSARLSVVHATHLTDGDIRLLGQAGVHAVFCPTTEADLGDGIGPARRTGGGRGDTRRRVRSERRGRPTARAQRSRSRRATAFAPSRPHRARVAVAHRLRGRLRLARARGARPARRTARSRRARSPSRCAPPAAGSSSFRSPRRRRM